MDCYSTGCFDYSFLAVVYTGKGIRRITPKGGINETQYVEVNGQEMWISIYGKDINNPVLLYLHGGPGYSSSYADYAIMRRIKGLDIQKADMNAPCITQRIWKILYIKQFLVIMTDYLNKENLK